MNIESHIFIIIITERNVVAKMPSGDAVYLITGVEFIPFDKNIREYTNMPLELVKFVDGVKNVLQKAICLVVDIVCVLCVILLALIFDNI